MKKMLLGIGNELKGDDGIGNIIARQFRHDGWKSVPCETVPENFTAVVGRESPDILVIVDAADMELPPGEIRIIPKEKLGAESTSTHRMPLRHLVEHLSEYTKQVVFIGIQPKSQNIGDEVSEEVFRAKKKVMKALEKNDFSFVERL